MRVGRDWIRRSVKQRLGRYFVVRSEWVAMQRRSRLLESIVMLHPENKARLKRAVEALQPQKTESNFVRIGSPAGDGGYVFSDSVWPPTKAVSIGVGSEMSADLALAALGTKVDQWDHTITSPPATHHLIWFNQVGLSELENGEVTTIDRMVADLNVESPEDVCVLLCDVEGSEWTSLLNRMDVLAHFDQMVIEFHDLLEQVLSVENSGLELLEQLRAGFVPIALHPNNAAEWLWTADGVVPNVVEVTYLRKDHFRPGATRPDPFLFDNLSTSPPVPNDLVF